MKESDLIRDEDQLDCDNELSSIVCDHSAKLLFNDPVVGIFSPSALGNWKLMNTQQRQESFGSLKVVRRIHPPSDQKAAVSLKPYQQS